MKEKNKHVAAAVAANKEEGLSTVLLEPREFLDSAIVGWIDVGEGAQVVYYYNAILRAFQRQNKWDHDTAQEWVDYNTLRALPYAKTDDAVAPMIIYGGEIA